MPVLFFSGGGNPCPEGDVPAKRLAANLRDYIDRGGFIFADGDPCSDKFDAGFRHLMELAFPEPEYRLKPLDESHPVWRAEQNVPPDQVRLLLGIDYGCRTSVIYSTRQSHLSAAVAGLSMGIGPGRAAGPLQPVGGSPDPRRPDDRHQRAGLCHEPRAAHEGRD